MVSKPGVARGADGVEGRREPRGDEEWSKEEKEGEGEGTTGAQCGIGTEEQNAGIAVIPHCQS